MRNISDEVCRGNQNTFNVGKTVSKNRVVYEIMWTNMVETERPQVAI
jgi:hypothetical protein